MRKLASLIVAAVAISVGMLASPAQADSPDTQCNIQWGSKEKRAGVATEELHQVTNVRSGRHQCFDRLVIDVDGATDATVYYDAPLGPRRGGANLVVVAGAIAYETGDGPPVYRPADEDELVDVSGYKTLRQVAFTFGDEGLSAFDIGVRARLPFRVMSLSDGRIVVDVAHRW